jgi:uncharacterized protein (TIGR02145 family)
MVGQQIWMAENLSYRDSSFQSDCYKDDVNNCIKFGRLYTWVVANKACPDEWRLPTKEEFQSLLKYAGGGDDVKAFKALTSDSTFGFNALLGGLYGYSTPTVFNLSGYNAVDGATAFWSSTESTKTSLASYLVLNPKKKKALLGAYFRKSALSVRCIKK